jgi:tungstate transport system ATP-binding protein
MSATSAPALYAVEDLRHRYGARTVLHVPSLRVAAGETLGVLGPSGAGKSTLLRLLQFLEPPSDGHLTFEGTPVGHPAPLEWRRRVTTVFQRPLLLDRTVRENVLFGARLRGRTERFDVDPLLERLALMPVARRPARRLSGGEVQRVALARAIAVRPDVLLLDEPAANLDPANVALIESVIVTEQRRGATIVLVTHNTHQARRLAHRTMLLLNGVPVEIAPTEALFDVPSDPRTRAFLAGEFIY